MIALSDAQLLLIIIQTHKLDYICDFDSHSDVMADGLSKALLTKQLKFMLPGLDEGKINSGWKINDATNNVRNLKVSSNNKSCSLT